MILRTTFPTLAMAFIAVAGCAQSDPVASPCHDIPTNGCPLYGDGTDCTDPCCAAMYDCIDGEFTLDHACPGFTGCDAGAPAPIPDAATCDLTGVDAPAGASGGQGCVELESPECPLSEALYCSPTPCLACESFWVCVDGAWILWGGCTAEGGVTLNH